MADRPRRRMSRDIPLVLLSTLPALTGCGGGHGDRAEPLEEVEEVQEEPAPDGPEQLIGGPFVGWWQATHPPVVVRRMVPRGAAAGTGGTYRSYPRGRSGFYSSSPGWGSSSRPAAPSPGVTRGGFGSTGHASAGG